MSAPDPLPRFIANGPHGRAVVTRQKRVLRNYVMGVAIDSEDGDADGWQVQLNDAEPELYDCVESAIQRARVLAGTVEMR